MLAVLDDLASHRTPQHQQGFEWHELDDGVITRYLPFWTAHDIQRITKSLTDKGVVLVGSAPYMQSRVIKFAFNETAKAKAPQPTQKHNIPVRGANRIATDWQPSDDVLAQLKQRSIPDHFIREQLPEFITYWRERDEPAHAWGSKFIRHVLHAWRSNETQIHRRETTNEMTDDWRPSADAMDVLIQHTGINPQFLEDAIPEFILYWQERGESSRTWNSKFIQHVRRQWNRYTATVENETVPKPIPEDWQPGDDVYDVLRLANIDIGYAKQLVPEFVLYWFETKQVNTSWNTKFLQHVKYHWAKSHNKSALKSNQNGEQTSNTRGRSLVDDLTDRSWAY